MKNVKKFTISFVIFLMLVIPIFSFAASLVPCGTTANPAPCDFNALMTLINNIINFIFVYMAVPIAAIMFVYAGFLMVTSGGSTENVSRAKSIFKDAVFGLIIAIAAWIIVKTILSILGYNGAWILNGF